MASEFRFITVSSLEKIFEEESFKPQFLLLEDSMLFGERYSFQAAYCLKGTSPIRVMVQAGGTLAKHVIIRKVDSVPSKVPADAEQDEPVLRTTPGRYPDILLPLNKPFEILPNQWGSLWITIPETCTLPAGKYELQLSIVEEQTGEVIGRCQFSLQRLQVVLPPQTLLHTEWFHADCIANWYQVPVFGEKYWDLIEKYLKGAVSYGVNMILTPLFTPPLDTEPGGERTTVQLVDVYKVPSGYKFGFEKLERWIKLCKKCGIRHFEFSHLFTQWGAKYAPKIMAFEGEPETLPKDAEPIRIFGWETEALSDEYITFLRAFLSALMQFIHKQHLEKQCYFHISDEPKSEQLADYLKAREIIKPLIEDCPIMDACSDYDFYEQGIMDIPVCCSDHLEPFIEHQVPNMWTYYCSAQKEEVSNRFFGMPSLRNRVLGVQLYKYKISGFLHWGYNFWNSGLSIRHINPYEETDAGGALPSGDCFLVYPGDEGPVGSIRAEVFYEGLQDMRLLQLVESLTSREEVMDLIDSTHNAPITFKQYPRRDEWVFELRKRCQGKIVKSIYLNGKG